ncbi:MAG TPA: glycerophosphoryl diester phosphodiesterase membrane domain-containing protein [Allosphingosinicella sp.]
MRNLSITTAWNESTDFLKLHFGALFTIALAMIAVPSVVLHAFGPAAEPGRAPEPGLWLLLIPAVLVLNIAASLAMSSLALGRRNVVGEAIGHGFRRFLPLLGAILILIAGMLVLLLPLGLLSGITAEELAAPTPAKAGRMALIGLLFSAVGLFFAVRLLLMTPVAAAEPAGPMEIIRRSWKLTGPHFWKLLGFILLILILFAVVSMVVTILFGLLIAAVAGAPEPGSLASLVLTLVGAIVNAAFVVVTTTLIARIYIQLSGGAPAGASGAASGI